MALRDVDSPNDAVDPADAMSRPDSSATPVIDASPVIDSPAAGVCSAQGTLSCSGLTSGSMLSDGNTVSGHSCSTLDTSNGDTIFSFTPASTSSVTLTPNVVDDDILFGNDFDLYGLNGVCDPINCLVHGAALGDESVTFTAVAGQTYFLVVEVFSFGLLTSGNYSLSVSCP